MLETSTSSEHICCLKCLLVMYSTDVKCSIVSCKATEITPVHTGSFPSPPIHRKLSLVSIQSDFVQQSDDRIWNVINED